MANRIKYNKTGSETNSVFKGDWAIDHRFHGGGPTGETGIRAGATIPAGGYAFYGPGEVARTLENDAELLTLVGGLGGDSSSVSTALAWADTQNNILILKADYKPIDLNNLIFNVDIASMGAASNLANNNVGVTLNNGLEYTGNENTLNFDGVDDELEVEQTSESIASIPDWTIEAVLDFSNISVDTLSAPTIFRHIPSGGSNTEGDFHHSLSFYDSRTDGLWIDSSDNIYACGFFGGYQSHLSSSLVKIGPNGAVDLGFEWHVAANTNKSTRRVLQYSNGDLLVYGRFLSSYGINRANSSTGASITNPPSTNNSQSNGDCLLYDDETVFAVGGIASTYNGQTIKGIVKVDGTDFLPIQGFDTSTGFDADLDSPNTIAKCSDGAIIVGGSFTEYKGTSVGRIVKINPTTGAIDTSFVQGTGFDGTVSDILADGNGNLAIRGAFNNYNGTSCARLVILDEEGSVVTTYPTFNNWIYGFEFQDDGKLITCGPYTQLDGDASRRYITRFNTDGTVDLTFGSEEIYTDHYITGVKKQSSGKLIIVGSFTAYGNTESRGIARLNTDGSLDGTFNPGDGFNRGIYRSNSTIRGAGGAYKFMGLGLFGQPTGEKLYQDGAIFWEDKVHQLAVSFDSSTGTFNFFRNGRLRGTRTYEGWVQNLNPGSFRFSEHLRELRVYNKPLTTEEIRKNAYREDIIVENLIANLDSQNILSKPRGQNTWWDMAGLASTNPADTDTDIVLYNGASLVNGAISLDGVDDYGYVQNGPSGTVKDSTFTITFDDTNQGSQGYLFYLSSVFGIIWRYQGTRFYIRVNNITDGDLDIGINSIPLGKKQLTITIDENYYCFFYLNGDLVGEGDFSGYHLDYNWDLYWNIGRSASGSNYSSFDYYNIMLYNGVLTSDQVKYNYKIQKTRFGL